MTLLRSTSMLLLCAALAACATPRFDTAAVDTAVTPRAALERIPEIQDQRVLWGGTIIQTQNLRNASRLEVLAYPLGEDQRPNTNATPLGRFLAEQPGYLEREEFAPGRHVTLLGAVKDKVDGQIGEADYVYPLISIEQLEMWPVASTAPRERSRFNFGVGIGIGL